MPSHSAIRAHILSIRDEPVEEELLETFWLRDPEIEVHYVKCGANALDYLQQEQQKIPNLIVLAWRFRESQMSAMETLAALKSR